MRCLLNKFLSAQHSIVTYGCYVVRQISETHLCCKTLILYPSNDSPFSPPPLPWQPPFCFVSMTLNFRYFIYVESCGIYPSGTDISLSTASPAHPFCCKRQGIFFFSVIELNNIPLCVHTTVSLLICQWKFGLCDYCCNEYERAAMSLRS